MCKRVCNILLAIWNSPWVISSPVHCCSNVMTICWVHCSFCFILVVQKRYSVAPLFLCFTCSLSFFLSFFLSLGFSFLSFVLFHFLSLSLSFLFLSISSSLSLPLSLSLSLSLSLTLGGIAGESPSANPYQIPSNSADLVQPSEGMHTALFAMEPSRHFIREVGVKLKHLMYAGDQTTSLLCKMFQFTSNRTNSFIEHTVFERFLSCTLSWSVACGV